MTCQELEHFLQAYLDGEFEAAERVELEGHLAACADCARQVHRERLFRDALRARARALANTPAPESLRRALRGSLRREQRRGMFARWAKLGAAAAAVALGVTSALLYHRTATRQKYVEDAAARHAKRFPLEISRPSAAEVEYWFHGKLGHPVSIPALSNAVVAGARLLNVQNKQAAYISYDADTPGGRAPGRIGLLVYGDAHRDAPFGALPQAEVDNSQGFNVVSWRDGDVVYQLVSDLDEADIRRMLTERSQPAEALPTLPVRPASLQR